MIKKRKNSLKQGSAWFLLCTLLLLTQDLAANYSRSTFFGKFLTAYRDTTVRPRLLKNDTVPVVDGKKDTTIHTTDTLHVQISKDSLDDKVDYEASDSMVLDIPNQRMILYSKGKVSYKDMTLTADSILMDQKTNQVTATFRRDTAGNMVGQPVMEQAGTKTISNLIIYNTKTQKGISRDAITQQGEMYVQGEKVKRASPSVFFAFRGQITTCNLDTPHFAFRTRKMKLVNQKLAISGPIHPEFENVPVPIYLPFGFFPLSQGRHSGLLPPQFSASDQFGLGLEGLGYYKVINDYFDVTLRSNIYSYGGWALFVTPTYRKRYRYNGTFNFSLQNSRILSSDAKQDFTTARTFNVTWSHTVDSRARPGTSFSANVNAGSTKYNQYVTNNTYRNYSNQLNSSIAYSKTWGTKYNLTASANHNQNNLNGVISLNLPTVAFTVNTLYPFQSKESVGTGKWYEKLGIGLNTNLANQVSVYEKDFKLSKLLDTMQYGIQHSIPIQLALPPLGPLQVSPGISYQEKWYSRKQFLTWNPVTEKVDTSTQKGFYTARDISFSLSLSTALYGKFDRFGKKSFMKAIRHVIRPTASFSFKPDLAKASYNTTQINTKGYTQRYSYYNGSIYGAFSEGRFAGMSFGLDNNLEAKVRSKKDSTGEKKIKLIDGFGITGSYNFLADSFKLSPMSIYLRSTLFDKINITAGAVLDPYQKDSLGFSINKYAWQKGKFSLGAITSGNVAISTSFQSKPKDAEKSKKERDALNNNPVLTPEEQLAQLSYVRSNPAEFADFNVEWSLSMSFSLNFSRTIRSDYSGYYTTTNANYNWNGDFNLTPRWKVGLNGYYDITNRSLQSLTMFISREMHCWQMSINVTPVGLFRTFNITLNPKSGVLRDLRINRTRYFYGM